MSQKTTLECFEDLMGRLQKLPDFFEKRKQLAELLGVEDPTIRRWVSGSGNPVGMSMINLRSYLDFLGYEVSEFLREPEVMRDASRLLAFRVLTLDELTKLVDFGQYTDQVLAVLRGARGVSKEREDRFVHLVGAYRSELAKAQATLPRLVELEEKPRRGETKVAGETASVSPTTASSEMVSVPLDAQMRAEHFRCLVHMLLDHARYYIGPELPDEVRDHLRSVAGQRTIFELKNHLARLCGNTAYKSLQS
jgi:transcriptional regulator with XRE-family HTH domain